ncbi:MULTISPECIES: BglG family transcription antiterminator [Caloramator]|uniref:Transcriptional antiterminator, BglG family n=1 Tax=Caloramator proteoclasticus DSM 10124 TaxID=1121262 RepID=A0A1M5BE54_9CLOT|nr:MULTISPECIES: PRD domain-containing protein [Caloramator]SHF40736.1 transcriptional antiterminator, BglG family [Caloramator proteoclasticus DSM 10124]
MEGYVVTKVLSNNVVITQKGDEIFVLTGKGIGFGKKKGDPITEKDIIEQKFIQITNEHKENYDRLLKTVNDEIIAVSEEIIELARERLGTELNPHIHIGLTDHINFAITRLKEGINIINPFEMEIKTMYPTEYSIAEEAIELVKKRIGVELPESEKSFIALHIYSAKVNQTVGETLKYTEIVKDVIDFIQRELNIKIDEKSLDYIRLISHLRYALYRIENNKPIKNILLGSIKRQLKEEYKLSKRACEIIEKKLDKKVPEDEIGYIAVHLGRIKTNS